MKNIAMVLAIGTFAACLSISCNNGSSTDSVTAAKDSNTTKMDSTGTDTSGSGKTGTIPATVSKADQDFAVNTANAGMTEIRAGKLAEQQGMSADVKKIRCNDGK